MSHETADLVWYAPMYSLYRAREELKKSPGRELKKKIDELVPVAVTCMGLYQATGVKHFLRPTSSRERTPDYRTMHMDTVGGKVRVNAVDVEVTEFEKNSAGRDVGEFILNKKLEHPRKAYDPNVAFLCFLNARIRTTWQDVIDVLKSSGKPNDVYVIGRTRPDRGLYTLVQVHPRPALHIEVDTHDRNVAYRPNKVCLYREGAQNQPPSLPDIFDEV